MADDRTPEPRTDDQRSFLRRRLVVGGAVAVVLLLVVWLVFLRDDGDGDVGRPPDAPLPTEPAGDVLDRYRASPCSLVTAPEILQATTRQAEVDGGGPEALCTYDLQGEPADDTITAQVIGPLDADRYDELTAGADDVAGKPAARWVDGGGTGGTLLARRNLVVVEIGVRIADTNKEQLQQIGRALLDHALARIPKNTPGGGASTTTAVDGNAGTCDLVDVADVAEVLGGEVTATQSDTVAACSFQTLEVFASVEEITGTLPDLDLIRRSTTLDGKEVSWDRKDLDLGDGAVFLANPADGATEGELYVLDGDVLQHVSVRAAEDPEATATALAELLLP